MYIEDRTLVRSFGLHKGTHLGSNAHLDELSLFAPSCGNNPVAHVLVIGMEMSCWLVLLLILIQSMYLYLSH